MADINLVTGYTGEAHVRSEDDAFINAFMLGIAKDCIADSTESHTNSEIVVNLDAFVDGRLIRTDDDVTFAITSAGSGYYRFDTISVEYYKDENGIEHGRLMYNTGTKNQIRAEALAHRGQSSAPSGAIGFKSVYAYMIEIYGSTVHNVAKVTGSGTLSYSAKLQWVLSDTSFQDVANFTFDRISLANGYSLYFGRIFFTFSMEAGHLYGFRIDTSSSGINYQSMLCGGVQIDGHNWGDTQSGAHIGFDKMTVALTPGANTTGGLLNVWFIIKD